MRYFISILNKIEWNKDENKFHINLAKLDAKERKRIEKAMKKSAKDFKKTISIKDLKSVKRNG